MGIFKNARSLSGRPKASAKKPMGEGVWVKYKGRSVSDGDDVSKMMDVVDRVAGRDSLRADKMLQWPGESGDKEGVRGVPAG